MCVNCFQLNFIFQPHENVALLHFVIRITAVQTSHTRGRTPLWLRFWLYCIYVEIMGYPFALSGLGTFVAKESNASIMSAVAETRFAICAPKTRRSTRENCRLYTAQFNFRCAVSLSSSSCRSTGFHLSCRRQVIAEILHCMPNITRLSAFGSGTSQTFMRSE